MTWFWMSLATVVIVGVLILAAALFPHPRDWRKEEFERQLRKASNQDSGSA